MADLSREDVLKLAQLARLNLTDDEINHYQAEIIAVLGYVEQLQSVDVTDIPPTSQVGGQTNATRPDEIIDYGVTTEDLLKNAPKMENNQFKVARMVG